MRAAAALLLAACASPNGQVLARGALIYDVAAAGSTVASLELETDFRLVVRGPAARAIGLGPPDWDFVDVALDGAGALAAVAGLDGTVRLFDLRTGAERGRWRLDASATAVALSPDGAWLLTGADSGVLCLRRAADGALLQCVAAHEARISAIAFDGDVTAVSAGWDGRAIVWQVPSLRVLASRPRGLALAAAAAAAGKVALARSDARILVWRWRDDTIVEDLPAFGLALAFLPDGRLASAGADRTVRIWPGRTASGFPGAVRGLAVSGDGRWLYVAGWSGRDLDAPALTALSLP